MPQADFVQGNWETYVLQAAGLKTTWQVSQETLGAADSIVTYIMSIL